VAIGSSNGIHILFVASKLSLMCVCVKGLFCVALLDDIRNSRLYDAD
jgi:hypothetical protein